MVALAVLLVPEVVQQVLPDRRRLRARVNRAQEARERPLEVVVLACVVLQPLDPRACPRSTPGKTGAAAATAPRSLPACASPAPCPLPSSSSPTSFGPASSSRFCCSGSATSAPRGAVCFARYSDGRPRKNPPSKGRDSRGTTFVPRRSPEHSAGAHPFPDGTPRAANGAHPAPAYPPSPASARELPGPFAARLPPGLPPSPVRW